MGRAPAGFWKGARPGRARAGAHDGTLRAAHRSLGAGAGDRARIAPRRRDSAGRAPARDAARRRPEPPAIASPRPAPAQQVLALHGGFRHRKRVLTVHHWNDTLFSFTHHARPEPALRERPLRDGRPGGRRQAADARLQHREPELRGAPRVLQHQGAERPAHLAPAAPEGRRPGPGRPQADRHAGADRPAAGQATSTCSAPAPASRRS